MDEGGGVSPGWNRKGGRSDIYGRGECLDVEEQGASVGQVGGESHVEEASIGGDGSPDVELQVASPGGLVVVWVSQHEGDLMELVAGCPLVEIQ